MAALSPSRCGLVLVSSLRVTKTGRAVLAWTLVPLEKNKGAVPSTGRPTLVVDRGHRPNNQNRIPSQGTAFQAAIPNGRLRFNFEVGFGMSESWVCWLRVSLLYCPRRLLARSFDFRFLRVTLTGYTGALSLMYVRAPVCLGCHPLCRMRFLWGPVLVQQSLAGFFWNSGPLDQGLRSKNPLTEFSPTIRLRARGPSQ